MGVWRNWSEWTRGRSRTGRPRCRCRARWARSGQAGVCIANCGRTRTRVVSGPAELVRLIPVEKPGVVVNAVGPYGLTSLPLARASLAAGVHYLDQANELGPVRELLELDGEARHRGVTLVTGAGFGVLATGAGDRAAKWPPSTSARHGRRLTSCRGAGIVGACQHRRRNCLRRQTISGRRIGQAGRRRDRHAGRCQRMTIVRKMETPRLTAARVG